MDFMSFLILIQIFFYFPFIIFFFHKNLSVGENRKIAIFISLNNVAE